MTGAWSFVLRKNIDNYFPLCYFSVVNQLNMCRTKYPGDWRKPPEGVTLTGVIGRIVRLQIVYISLYLEQSDW